ncbi:MAG: hypothetical protein HKN42_17350 [Granulosicoccus sp.]|nr:hypothetical protein [Granulosicoccus sp.]
MKTRQRRTAWRGRISAFVSVALLSLTLASCGGGGGDGDGGIVGTGMRLKGTTSDNRAYASNEIEYKSATGERGTVPIGSDGRFTTSDLQGEGPWLLRADLGNSDYLYGLGFDDGTDTVTQNVHDYTDLVARNWFARAGLDIDSTFSAAGAINNAPQSSEIAAIGQTILGILADVLGDYSLAGINPYMADYAAGTAGLGQFLNQNPVFINNGQITIIINDPVSDTQGVATSGIALDTDLETADTTPPTTPANLRVLAAGSNEIVAVWTPSTDNVGISTYQVLRDGVLLDTTPYPVFIDSTLAADASASYSIIAVDAAGNESAETAAVNVTNSTTTDTTAPPAPAALALTATSGSVIASWNQTDIGDVVAFRVYRGTAGSATTRLSNVSATFYNDSQVQAGTEYCYRVSAVDAAGNESVSTAVQCTTTAGSVVTPPTNNPGTGSGDTAVGFASTSFQVLEDASTAVILVSRTGNAAEAVSIDYTVTSGTATAGVDFTATSGTLSWAAGDSGDKRINVQIAADTEVETDETFVVTLSNASSNVSIAGETSATVTINNRDSAVCSTELETTTIDEDTVLDLPCYIVSSNINVNTGANLTIQPGVRLEFASGLQMVVRGSLTAEGTAQNPIILTGRERTEGFWDGVQFFFTNSVKNSLSNVIIEYGGSSSNDNALLWVRSSGTSPSRITVDSVTLRNSMADGFSLDSDIIFGGFTNSVVTLNERAGRVSANSAGALVDSNSFSGNTSDVIEVDGGSVDRDSALAGVDASWLITALLQVQQGQDLTIQPGARLLFDDSMGITVRQGGNLVAVGTTDNPIVMQGQTASPGRWRGIEVFFTVGLDTRLEHVTIEHAGSSQNDNSAVWVRSSGTSPATLGLSHVTISQSAGTGIKTDSNVTFTAFDNVTVTQSASAAVMHADNVDQIGDNNVFTGNTEDLVNVTTGTISDASSWGDIGVPYLTENIAIEATLTLAPGVEIWGNSASELTIRQSGALNAVGTQADPILMRGAEQVAGYWQGLQFFFSPSTQNVLSNVVVQHGGGAGAPANIWMRCSGTSPGRLTLSNASIEFSATYGVEVDNNGCTYTETNVTFSNNASGDYNGPQ